MCKEGELLGFAESWDEGWPTRSAPREAGPHWLRARPTGGRAGGGLCTGFLPRPQQDRRQRPLGNDFLRNIHAQTHPGTGQRRAGGRQGLHRPRTPRVGSATSGATKGPSPTLPPSLPGVRQQALQHVLKLYIWIFFNRKHAYVMENSKWTQRAPGRVRPRKVSLQSDCSGRRL